MRHGQNLDNVCVDNRVAAPVQAIAAGLDEGADIMGLQADGYLIYLYAEMSGYLNSTIPRWDIFYGRSMARRADGL
jgi:hypothetical protein